MPDFHQLNMKITSILLPLMFLSAQIDVYAVVPSSEKEDRTCIGSLEQLPVKNRSVNFSKVLYTTNRDAPVLTSTP